MNEPIIIGDHALYHGDCLEVMKELSLKGIKVDMVLTDPPYGTTACKWDNVIPFEPMRECINSLIKDNGAIALFGSEPFSSMLRCGNLKKFRYDWIWEKSRPSNFPNAKNHPMKYHEIISIFSSKRHLYTPIMTRGDKIRRKWGNEGASIFNSKYLQKESYLKKEYKDFYPKSIIKYANSNYKSIHPTQKPVPLLEYLIKTYTNEGDTVLDFTAGSFSTGIACINTNRKFIGIELDDKYFEIGRNRMENHKKQVTLEELL